MVIKGEGIIKDETQISVQMTGCVVMLFSGIGKLTAPGLGGEGGGYFFFNTLRFLRDILVEAPRRELDIRIWTQKGGLGWKYGLGIS